MAPKKLTKKAQQKLRSGGRKKAAATAADASQDSDADANTNTDEEAKMIVVEGEGQDVAKESENEGNAISKLVNHLPSLLYIIIHDILRIDKKLFLSSF